MNIVANQERAFVNQALRDATRLAHTLRTLSPAEQAAILATIAAAIACPIDIVLTTAAYSDCTEAAALMDGKQLRGSTEWSWPTSSGCEFVIDLLSREGIPHV